MSEIRNLLAKLNMAEIAEKCHEFAVNKQRLRQDWSPVIGVLRWVKITLKHFVVYEV